MGERLKTISSLPIKDKWDGKSKFYTKECSECRWHRQYFDGEACLAGVCWKKLDRTKVFNTCSAKKKFEKDIEEQNKPKQQFIVYTPSFRDYLDGTLDMLEQMGFITMLVPKDDNRETGFSIEER